ncbi:MAG: SIR2 family protein [Clostridiales bacterium]|nr:SIR2 family protein [Clostridiales bacterium]
MIFTQEQQEFISNYANCLKKGCASVFLGSGLSRKSGYTGWADLLKKYARDIGLDIKKEQADLISLAQYYVNSKQDSIELKKYICKVFAKSDDKKANINHLLLSSFPLQSYWTTNYDTLIEQALDYRDLRYNKIIVDKDLRKNENSHPIWLYKMHGDVDNYNSIIITKQDYENYYDKYEMVLAKFKSEICTKTFLFLGYSISDPNVMHILARARKVFDKNSGRTHYAVMEKPKATKPNEKTNRKYKYEIIKQQHQIADLAEYGIKVILVDDYEQITDILQEIVSIVYGKNVLISGAFEKETANNEEIRRFTENLAVWLIKNNYKIFTGYGKNLGQHIVAGAFEGCKLRTIDEKNMLESVPDVVSVNQRVVNNFNSKVFLFPFPYDVSMLKDEREDLYHRLRKNMIASTQITIIICGEKYKNSKDISDGLINSDGVIEEFEISKNQGNYILPISLTGGAAKKIMDNLELENDFYKSKAFNSLKYAKSFDEVLRSVQELLKIL